MANSKMCSISYVIRETQIKKKKKQKKPVKYQPPLLEWPKSRTLTTPNAGEDMEQQEHSFIAKENTKQYSHFGRQFQSFLHY